MHKRICIVEKPFGTAEASIQVFLDVISSIVSIVRDGGTTCETNIN